VKLTTSLWLVAMLYLPSAWGDSAWRLRMDGFGPVKIGMTPAQVKSVIGVRVLEDINGPPNECWYMRALGELDGVSLMIIGGQVARIEIDSPKFHSLSGGHIGSTESALRKMYGASLRVEQHRYLEEAGSYLTLRSKDGKFGIRFEAEKRNVFRFYAGAWEHLRYVEGCA
jgi:hypothetical protein